MIHWLRRNRRTTGCGRKAKRTTNETQKLAKVTCRTCLRFIAAKRKACAELAED
jgi:hypothetical protein